MSTSRIKALSATAMIAGLITCPSWAKSDAKAVDRAALLKMLPENGKVGDCQVSAIPIRQGSQEIGFKVQVVSPSLGITDTLEYQYSKEWADREWKKGNHSVGLMYRTDGSLFHGDRNASVGMVIATQNVSSDLSFWKDTVVNKLMRIYFDKKTEKVIGVSVVQMETQKPLLGFSDAIPLKNFRCGDTGRHTGFWSEFPLGLPWDNSKKAGEGTAASSSVSVNERRISYKDLEELHDHGTTEDATKMLGVGKASASP